MFPLIALALIGYLVMSQGKKGTAAEQTMSSQAKGWSILLQGPAALPQAAVPELARALGIQSVKYGMLASPQMGFNVFTVVTPDVVLGRVGQTLNVMGVPLTIKAITPAPIS